MNKENNNQLSIEKSTLLLIEKMLHDGLINKKTYNNIISKYYKEKWNNVKYVVER